jgi:hypothetical protein
MAVINGISNTRVTHHQLIAGTNASLIVARIIAIVTQKLEISQSTVIS